MSAILKALKKIDRESSGEVRPQPFSKNLDPKKVIHQRVRKEWFLRRLVSVLVPLLFVASVIVPVMAVKSFLPGSTVFLPPLSQVHGEEEKGGEPGVPEELSREPTAPAARAALESATGPSQLQEPLFAFSGNPMKEAAYSDLERSPLPAETLSRAEENPALELQAIVWSDDPASCFAVINGRIVRSGGMVDGVSVIEIRKEAVSLKLGEKTWTLRMLEGD